MKKNSNLVIILTLFLLLLTPYSATANDINGHYFEKDIQSLIDRGFMVGYGDGNYKPNREVTRAEFAIFLVRILDLQQNNPSIHFHDVKKSDWHYTDLTIASSNNLINGYPDGTFKPKSLISRQELAAMVHRALQIKGISAEKSLALTYKDKNKINPIYYSAIQQLLALNIIVGKIDTNGNRFYEPLRKTTRGETAAILNRMINLIDASQENIAYTHYTYNFEDMISIQMTKTPKVDGSGKYIASRDLVSYYANPNNFHLETSEYLQFLILSQSSKLSAEEINRKILHNTGTLTGQGQAFIDASKQYNVNEVYLIAHALHETANGTSALAGGYLVSEVDGKSVVPKKTYNMYGIKAFDSNALKMGSEHAYKEGWFTPKDAIIGGAKFIAEGYINRGQDTLYEMRWNPVSPGYPQYATHVSWAVLQTYKMNEIYNLLDAYVLNFDVPIYNNQPSSSSLPTGEDQYYIDRSQNGTNGITTANLNIRTGPTTSYSIIKTIPIGTMVTIIGENGGWFKVSVDNTSGWVSGEYLNV